MRGRVIRKIRRGLPGFLLISPSLVLIGIFVYGFLGWNIRVSTTNWKGTIRPTFEGASLDNYRELNKDPRWDIDVRNVLIFTVVFIVGALVLGFLMAMLLEKGIKGEQFFRSVFLFPMAISFIATGIIWRWLLDNGSGTQTAGINKLLQPLGIRSDWYQTDSKWAIAALALPACWSLSGYIMALFLAGIRGVPEDLREAARVDGANEARVFWHVIRPMLIPVVMSAIVILAHISLKTFDLFYAIDLGNLRIDVPALYMWLTTYNGNNYAYGAAIATLLLLGIATVIVPYIWYSVRAERKP